MVPVTITAPTWKREENESKQQFRILVRIKWKPVQAGKIEESKARKEHLIT
jgi:hypothetical protein